MFHSHDIDGGAGGVADDEVAFAPGLVTDGGVDGEDFAEPFVLGVDIFHFKGEPDAFALKWQDFARWEIGIVWLGESQQELFVWRQDLKVAVALIVDGEAEVSDVEIAAFGQVAGVDADGELFDLHDRSMQGCC